MKKIELDVTGMKCKGCENRVINTLNELEGILNVKASFKKGKVSIKTNSELDMKEVYQKIQNLGFEVKKEE